MGSGLSVVKQSHGVDSSWVKGNSGMMALEVGKHMDFPGCLILFLYDIKNHREMIS